mmetsp:Transcript_15853/g.37419  ORF Transcript_15853/g.37419 Transcript_15853/m.37419 type:complete len:184 (+) Transcript_15853:97-648(+)
MTTSEWPVPCQRTETSGKTSGDSSSLTTMPGRSEEDDLLCAIPPQVFSRQTTEDTCFITHVDVIIAVPELASRTAFATYAERAGLDDSLFLALDEKDMADCLLEVQEGDDERPLMLLLGEDWLLSELEKLSFKNRKPYVVLTSGNQTAATHLNLMASCGQLGFNEALSRCVQWSLKSRAASLA